MYTPFKYGSVLYKWNGACIWSKALIWAFVRVNWHRKHKNSGDQKVTTSLTPVSLRGCIWYDFICVHTAHFPCITNQSNTTKKEALRQQTLRQYNFELRNYFRNQQRWACFSLVCNLFTSYSAVSRVWLTYIFEREIILLYRLSCPHVFKRLIQAHSGLSLLSI